MNKKKKYRQHVLHAHEFSPMARATHTPSKKERQRKRDRRRKQRGWRD